MKWIDNGIECEGTPAEFAEVQLLKCGEPSAKKQRVCYSTFCKVCQEGGRIGTCAVSYVNPPRASITQKPADEQPSLMLEQAIGFDTAPQPDAAANGGAE